MTPFVCLSLSMAFWLQGSFAHWLSTSFCKAPWVFTLYILAFLYEMNESSEEGFWIHSLFLCQQNLVTENLSKRCLVSLLYDFLVCLPAQLTRYKFFKEMLFFFFLTFGGQRACEQHGTLYGVGGHVNNGFLYHVGSGNHIQIIRLACPLCCLLHILNINPFSCV